MQVLRQKNKRSLPLIPEEQTLLMVVQTTELGIPAPSAACLAGACPKFALRTLPKNTSCTTEGSKFALLRAAEPKTVLMNIHTINGNCFTKNIKF